MPPVSDQSTTPPLSRAAIAHYQELRAVLVYVQRQPRGRLVSIDEVAAACAVCAERQWQTARLLDYIEGRAG